MNPDLLTEKQLQVVKGIASGLNAKTVALELGISPKTVEGHYIKAIKKLNLQSQIAVTHFALHTGLVKNMFETLKR